MLVVMLVLGLLSLPPIDQDVVLLELHGQGQRVVVNLHQQVPIREILLHHAVRRYVHHRYRMTLAFMNAPCEPVGL